MKCLSCHQEVPNRDAKLVLKMYLCNGCGEMAISTERQLEVESARALEVAKSTLAEHIMKGGLLRARDIEEEDTKRVGLLPR